MDSGRRAAVFAGRPRPSTARSRTKAKSKADRAGYRKAFVNLRGYRS